MCTRRKESNGSQLGEELPKWNMVGPPRCRSDPRHRKRLADRNEVHGRDRWDSGSILISPSTPLRKKWLKEVFICIWIKRGKLVDQAATHYIHFMSALRIMFANIVGGSRQQSELWVRFHSPQISYIHTHTHQSCYNGDVEVGGQLYHYTFLFGWKGTLVCPGDKK